ncbi:uncharacterized protein [Embiotoca jacksoni]|uniref:uncharacterized protein n=1 Tax=Embiotoca jacksoni TaxID=100190 RepID=UPI00370385FB
MGFNRICNEDRADTIIPITTVQVGQPATLIGALPNLSVSRREVHWYKQSFGESLKVIVTLRTLTEPKYAPEFSNSRWEVKIDNNFSNLTIVRTIPEDEGVYHCATTEWLMDTDWSGTYLVIKGNSQRTSNYTVTQWPTASGPGRDSATLQCSILSDNENKMCPGDHSVFWFRAESDESHPDTIYTDGNRNNECEKKSDAQESCDYRFSKKISSSDAGTYYCAVATCGRILFRKGMKNDLQGCMFSQEGSTVIFLLCAVLAISLIVIAVLIHAIKKNKSDSCKAAVGLQKKRIGQKHQQKDEDTWIYSAVVFTMMKADRNAVKDAKAAEREKIYTAVKALGLD